MMPTFSHISEMTERSENGGSREKHLTRRQPTFGKMRHVHMVGIGGIGMSSIAEVLLMRGYRITGSDMSSSDVTKHLEEKGATIFVGHHGPNAS